MQTHLERVNVQSSHSPCVFLEGVYYSVLTSNDLCWIPNKDLAIVPTSHQAACRMAAVTYAATAPDHFVESKGKA